MTYKAFSPSVYANSHLIILIKQTDKQIRPAVDSESVASIRNSSKIPVLFGDFPLQFPINHIFTESVKKAQRK